METGANKGQAGFILTALDGKQDLPPGDHPLWIFDEGHAVRWLRTTEDRSALVEAAACAITSKIHSGLALSSRRACSFVSFAIWEMSLLLVFLLPPATLLSLPARPFAPAAPPFSFSSSEEETDDHPAKIE